MSTQSTNVAFLIGTIAILSLIKTDCVAVKEDEKGFILCVTSRRGMQDYSNQNLTNVPSNLPDDTQYLDISHNSIRRLSGASFSGLSQLCCLKVTHCGLQEISPSVFSHTPALKVLNISFNDLPIVPDISLKQLKILDLAYNLYKSYRIPASFQNLANLDVLSLGSPTALSVNYNDFDPLSNVSLSHLVLGAGIRWQKYDSGALAKLKSLKTISVFASFCGEASMFQNLLADVNVTGAKSLRIITLFPDNCNVTGNFFDSLKTMPLLKNLTIENTWINSSFMEVFMKNVWFSHLYDLSFVNITYNEDTPDGFQFRTINHSVNICSITFNGVKHYQYKYPQINMSLEAVSNLTYLKFSGTGLNILPCNLLSVLPSLETLDLSDNLLKDTGFWWFLCLPTSVFPKLRRLYLSKNRFNSLAFISEKTNQMKTLESLDLSFNSISLDGDCSWPAQLIELSLANNNLGNNVFNYLSVDFEKIDLSKTGITAITQKDLSRFHKLTHLQLSSNSIQVIPADLSAPSLLNLYVDQNAITSISKLAGLSKLQTLKAGNNPFVCSCDSYWFVSVLNKSLLADWPLDYTCSTPPSFAGVSLSEYKTSELSCEMWLQAAVAVPVLIIISAAIGLVFYKCDGVWYTKMLWVWIRVKRRGKKNSNMLKNVSFQYHAFISYSHQDSGWVDSRLVRSLEGSGFSLCVHERDFVPGDWIIDNIINCVESSYKTLFILSKHFVQSEWCNYELFFAQHRAVNIQQDSLVFILLEPIPTDSLPKKFLRLRSLLRQQTYLEWPNDERKQQVFWASLKSMLRVADKSMVLKDVALAIADTATLVTDQI
ncbi:toll-like receptor 1 [Trematomus bernacchii]|uniref:toll-like receptor 1 n=1 Tax=Trematomus bernacchii TaxID=40690 RepID=UPI00146F6E6A|nr:toll-like receptor 1 [Trematomus bernacchii]